jgi:hypothetical protein
MPVTVRVKTPPADPEHARPAAEVATPERVA